MKTEAVNFPRWEGEITKDLLESIVRGLLVPSVEMSRRLAWELLRKGGEG